MSPSPRWGTVAPGLPAGAPPHQLIAVDHHANRQPTRDGQAADKLIGGKGTGALEALVLQRAEAQLYHIHAGGLHGIKVLEDQLGAEIPGVVVAAVAESAIEKTGRLQIHN